MCVCLSVCVSVCVCTCVFIHVCFHSLMEECKYALHDLYIFEVYIHTCVHHHSSTPLCVLTHVCHFFSSCPD